MNIRQRLLMCAVTLLALVNCEGYRDTVRGFGSSLGLVQTRDLQQAENYQKVLPPYLGLAPQQVNVMPGSGVANVIIHGVSADLERQRIDAALTTLNSQNPQADPVKWRFE